MTNENKKDVNFKGSITAKSRVEITDDNYIRKFFKIIYEEGDIIEFGLFNDELGLKAKRLWATRVAGRKVIANVTIDKIAIDEVAIDMLKDFNKTGYNIYCGINLRIKVKKSKPWEKSGAENVKSCRWLFVDCDLDKPPYSEIPKKQLLDFIKFKIGKAGLPTPTLIISTGHGYHVYWKLNKKLTPDVWDPIQNNLIYTLQADKRAKGTARIMRIPGFKNTKKKPFVKCRFEEYNKNTIYDLEQITKHLKEDPEIPDVKESDEAKAEDETRTKCGYKHNFTNLDILDWLVKVKIITAERAQSFSATRQNTLLISCLMPFHEGQDKTPSFKINIHGKHKGICTCFSCPKQDGKEFATYTIMEVILAKRGYGPFDKEMKDELAVEMEKDCPGFIKYDIFKLAYPADNLDVLLKRYFTIPKGKKRAGMHHLWWYRGMHYYYPKKGYINYNSATLCDFIWDKLKKGKYWKQKSKEFHLKSFPVDKFKVNQIMDVIREYRNVEAKKIGYAPDEKVNDIFYIDKTLPDLLPIENLRVVKNGILDVVNRKILDEDDPNLFSAASLPVVYDPDLEPPEVCIQTLKENLVTPTQINQHYKRDAFIISPNSDIQAFFIVTGLTGSGKGTDVRFTKSWIGSENYVEAENASVGEKFGMQNWPGTLVAFISDEDKKSVSDQMMANATKMYKKISGHDEINVRLPGGIWVNNVKLGTKIIYLATDIPKFANSTDEMVRRLVIEDYKSQWVEEDKENFPNRTGDPDLTREKKMIKEKDAYFTHCVINIGMKLLLSEKGFESTKETKQTKKRMLHDFAMYATFWTRTTEEAKGGHLVFSELFNVFKAWTFQTGHQDELISAKTHKEITPRVLSNRLRKVVRFETDDIGMNHTVVILDRKLNEYGSYLLNIFNNAIWDTPHITKPDF